MKKLIIFILIILSLAMIFTSCKEDDKKKLYESIEKEERVKDASGLEYAYLKEYDAYVLVGKGDCTSAHIYISAYINGKPVIAIKAKAFDTKDILQIYEITVPDTVRAIDDGAFRNNYNLTTINIGTNDSGLEGLGQSLLNGTQVNTINFKGTMSEWKSINFPTQKWENGWNYTDGSQTGTLKVVCTDGVIIYGTNGTGEIWEEIPNAKVSEGLEFRLDSSGHLYFVVGIGTCTDKNIIIPDTYQGKPVEGIWIDAFKNCTEIQSITIPKSVNSIMYNAFANCTSLKEVIFENPFGWGLWYLWYDEVRDVYVWDKNPIAEDLSNPSTAATLLTSTYVKEWWQKSVE